MREAVFLHSAEELEGHMSPRRSLGVSKQEAAGAGQEDETWLHHRSFTAVDEHSH